MNLIQKALNSVAYQQAAELLKILRRDGEITVEAALRVYLGYGWNYGE